MAHATARTAGRCRCGKVRIRTYKAAAGIAHRLGEARVYFCKKSGSYHVTNSSMAGYERTRARIGT